MSSTPTLQQFRKSYQKNVSSSWKIGTILLKENCKLSNIGHYPWQTIHKEIKEKFCNLFSFLFGLMVSYLLQSLRLVFISCILSLFTSMSTCWQTISCLLEWGEHNFDDRDLHDTAVLRVGYGGATTDYIGSTTITILAPFHESIPMRQIFAKLVGYGHIS